MQTFGNHWVPLGTCVWLSAKRIDLVVNTERWQVTHPDAFEALGIDLSTYREAGESAR